MGRFDEARQIWLVEWAITDTYVSEAMSRVPAIAATFKSRPRISVRVEAINLDDEPRSFRALVKAFEWISGRGITEIFSRRVRCDGVDSVTCVEIP